MKILRRPNSSQRFHVEGWPPAAVAAVGVAAGLAIVSIVYFGLVSWQGADFGGDAGTVLAAFVTATVGGGAAGLAMKNLNLKRAESRRAANVMFDSQFQSGATLLGGESESEVLAGSLLLSSLLRESPRHAQACADLLCASLRVHRAGDLDAEEEDLVIAQDPSGLQDAIAEGNRIRNSIGAAIAQATATSGAPPHVSRLRWAFEGSEFGDAADFSGCTFGPGTRFLRVKFGGDANFSGAMFAATVRFEWVTAPQGLFLRGIRVNGALDIFDSQFGRPGLDGSWGVLVNQAQLHGLVVERVTTNGNVQFDDAVVFGDIQVGNVECANALAAGATCHGRLEVHNVHARGDIALRAVSVRKQASVEHCSGRTLSVQAVIAHGGIRLDHNTFDQVTR